MLIDVIGTEGPVGKAVSIGNAGPFHLPELVEVSSDKHLSGP